MQDLIVRGDGRRTHFLANLHNKTPDVYGITVHDGIMKGWHATCPLSAQRARAASRRQECQGGTAGDGRQAAQLLFTLETAETLEQLIRFPGWKLHPLKGGLKGLWSLSVTGNWRLIFRYDERTNTASDIDLIDYH
jgi:proteic killer suppression protein